MANLFPPIAANLLAICRETVFKLQAFSGEDFSYRKEPHKWSRKEILGHLIDSAANNHQRFVRARFEPVPTIWYDQEQWVQLQQYETEDHHLLLVLWDSYNRHLAHVIAGLTEADATRECRGRDGRTSTLLYIAEDYVAHLQNHLRQIFDP